MVTPSDAHDKLFHCPALVAIKVVSGKWKTRILWLLRTRAYHFNELRRILPGVSGKVLTQQLQQLQTAGIITRAEVTLDGVAFVEYRYSDYGRTLIPALDALGDWGLIHSEQASDAR